MKRIFEDSWRRIERAVVHAEALKAEWEVLLKPNAFATTDAAIYRVSAIAENLDLPSNENRVEFPICLTSDAFAKSTVNKFPFPAEVRDWLESLQPYRVESTITNGSLNTYLRVLHDCARKDRHRRLHFVAAIPTEIEGEFEITKPGEITSTHSPPVNLLEGECQLLTFGLAGFNPGDGKRLRLKTKIRIEILVEDVPIPSGSNLGIELDMVLQATKQVIQIFEDGYQSSDHAASAK